MGLCSDKTKQETNALRNHWKRTIDPATVPPTQIRKCAICGEDKPCGWNYTFSRTGKPEYRTKCVDCFRDYSTKRQRDNRDSITKNRKARIRARKRECVAYLGGKCSECGYDKSIVPLTFHHIDPDLKDRNICTMLDWSWVKLKEELDKCVLLCFNCHMLIHGEDYGFENEVGGMESPNLLVVSQSGIAS